ncbi:MAG: GGDEF domain-containing protein [Desulfovibrionaceae bacterium]|nr:GGDEF domain-containing protein [Desulfovibrionaceae bacterium]
MYQFLELQAETDVLGRLADPQAEREFQADRQPATRRRLRFICAITATAYLGAAYADSTMLSGPPLSLLIAARCLAALTGLIPLFLSFNKKALASDMGLAAGLYMAVVMASECLELYLKADIAVLRETPITAYIVLTFYLFQPPQIWQSILCGGLGSVAYMLTLAFFTNAASGHVVNTALVFCLTNGFGLYFCIRFGTAQRREYVALTELKRQAETDVLTGLLNRRRVNELCEREFRAAKRYGHPCSLLLMDIDHFKAVNDAAGHAAGDAVLSALAERCSLILRMVDIFGRIGGEEFAVFMPHATGEQALLAAERIRQAVADEPFTADGKPFPVTVSIGGAAMASETDSLDSLFRRADDALYAAKRCGRNRVHF